MSHDPSEIILICWFAAQETILSTINMVLMVYSGSWLSYADSPVFLSAGRLHTSRHRSVVGLQRRSAGKPALQPAWLEREFDRKKKNILVRITEENAWMFPTKFWRQTDSNPHQKLWCKSALESEYYWHTYATHTHMPSHVVGRNNLFAAGLLESFRQTLYDQTVAPWADKDDSWD